MSQNAMNLTVPTPQVTTGPQYAVQVSNDLEIISDHTHTGASNNDGNQIPAAGLNINDDVSFQSNNATSLRSVRFSNQFQTLSGIGDIGCVYEKSGDLWYNNAAGTAIQITSGASLIAPTGGYVPQETSINLTINAASDTVLIACDTTSNSITITLPLITDVAAGRFYIIKDATGHAITHNITISPNGSNTIENTSGSLIVRNDFAGICVVSDGSNNWFVLKYASLSTPASSSSATVNIPDITEDAIYILDVSSNSITVNLPALTNVPVGVKISIKDNGSAASAANHINIVPNGVNFIEGLNATKSIITAYGEVNLVATSSGWFML